MNLQTIADEAQHYLLESGMEEEMDGSEFARELIRHFGDDRFYHCHLRMTGGNVLGTLHIYAMLEPPELPPWKCVEFFKSIGVKTDETLVGKVLRHPGIIGWDEMCMVAYGFCKFHKEFGRRTHGLPDHLHARMILGSKNKWTEQYARMLEDLKEEMDEVRKLPYRSDGSPVDQER